MEGGCALSQLQLFFCLKQLMKSITNEIIQYSSHKMNFFCFHNSHTEHYQYTSKAAVIKLSFSVCWPVMLLVCCRLQELNVCCCTNMTDRGLLEGIGSLHELTSLTLYASSKLSAQALCTFLHRPSTTSMVLLHLSDCRNLDDEVMKVIAERCNQLTYLHV
jgi:hypothetical protein